MGFKDRRDKIYQQARAYFADPNHTLLQWNAINMKRLKYNEDIKKAEMERVISFMRPEQLQQQRKNVAVPTKKERGRIQLTR